MDASFDRGADFSVSRIEYGDGMETERAGRSLALRGVGGMGERQLGVCGGSTRELERRRPHEPRVSGGRTLVEEAR